MKAFKLFLVSLLLFVSVALPAQDMILPVNKLLQYEAAKLKGKAAGRMFKKVGFERIPAHDVLRGRESCLLWGYRVKANLSYNQSTQPLYRVFRKTGLESIGLIDHIGGSSAQPVELVFWSKQIYRSYAAELRKDGFRQSVHNNTISFRNPEYTIGVDFDIWPDIYIMKVIAL